MTELSSDRKNAIPNVNQQLKWNEKDDNIFWCEFNRAISIFCFNTTTNTNNLDTESALSPLLGSELEWCGAYSIVFLAKKHLSIQHRCAVLEDRCKRLENMISSESSISTSLRKQLKDLQMISQDNEWQLQEQLAHANNSLSIERELLVEMQNKLAISEAKLVDVEMYFNSDKGIISLQMEQELAETKLKLAELEAEKDEYELQLASMNASSLKGNNQMNEKFKV